MSGHYKRDQKRSRSPSQRSISTNSQRDVTKKTNDRQSSTKHCGASKFKRAAANTPFESARDRKMRKRAAAYNGEVFRTNREQIALLKTEKDELAAELKDSEEKCDRLDKRNQSLEKGVTQKPGTNDSNRELEREKHKTMVLNRLINGYDHAATAHAQFIKTLLDDFGAEYELGFSRLGQGGSRYGGVDFEKEDVERLNADDFRKKFIDERKHYENNDQAITRASTNFRGDGLRSKVEATTRHDDLIREGTQSSTDENNNCKRDYDRSDSD